MSNKMVTITLNGITQTVPEKELPLYTRAGYKVVEESAPVPASITDPEPEAMEESAPVKKSAGKKN